MSTDQWYLFLLPGVGTVVALLFAIVAMLLLLFRSNNGGIHARKVNDFSSAYQGHAVVILQRVANSGCPLGAV